MKLIDAHCHLQSDRIRPSDVQSIITAAKQSGLTHFIVNGCWQDDWERVLSLSLANSDSIIPQFGLHPWWVGRRSEDWLPRLRRILIQHPHAGLGECGLDKGPKAPKDATYQEQKEAFESQLKLAQELQRPISIHCVKAFGAVFDSLDHGCITTPVVLHAWTGTVEMTKRFLQLPNVYFSLSGHLTRLAPQKAIDTINSVPLDRCLIESDCPDGLVVLNEAWIQALPQLQSSDGSVLRIHQTDTINTPCAVWDTLKVIAYAKNIPLEVIARATYENAFRIFCFHSSVQE